MEKKANVMRCANWYHLYNLKNVENTHGGVLILVKFTKIDTPPWVFLAFFKLYKWYQIAQRITNVVLSIIIITFSVNAFFV